MPLTDVQRKLLALLAPTRAPDGYLAGGAALHFEPSSTRYSRDLDFFHDSEERVAEAFATDRAILEGEGYEVEVLMSQPGSIRAIVRRGDGATQGTRSSCSSRRENEADPPEDEASGSHASTLLRPLR